MDKLSPPEGYTPVLDADWKSSREWYGLPNVGKYEGSSAPQAIVFMLGSLYGGMDMNEPGLADGLVAVRSMQKALRGDYAEETILRIRERHVTLAVPVVHAGSEAIDTAWSRGWQIANLLGNLLHLGRSDIAYSMLPGVMADGYLTQYPQTIPVHGLTPTYGDALERSAPEWLRESFETLKPHPSRVLTDNIRQLALRQSRAASGLVHRP